MPSSENFRPNNVWAQNTPDGTTEEMTLPSGQTCLARKMSIDAVIQTGLLDQVDILTQLVDKHTRMVKGGKTADGHQVDASILQDVEAMKAIIGLVDRLLPHMCVSPVIHLHWTETVVGKTTVTKLIPSEDREPGQVYTDMVQLDDKMALFEWSMGGLTEFSSFRRNPTGNVGTVGNVQRPRKSSKHRSRNR